MVWTAPRTWVAEEIVTTSMFNQQIRDNFTLLKITRDDAGQLLQISSATVGNLSPANITGGLAIITGANTFTAGKTDFRSARVIVPVGAAKSSGNGSMWIESTTFKYINDAAVTKTYTGVSVGTPAGAVVGSVWVEGNDIHYIDSVGAERVMSGTTAAMHSDTAALGGSVWMEALMHWIIQTGKTEILGHADIHYDSAHSDSGGSSHTDNHSDSHTDTGHADVAHVDTHGDYPHNDVHGDQIISYTGQHVDYHSDAAHSDVAHADVSHWDSAHVDVHGDTHGDTYTDNHGDAPAQNSHLDQPV